MANKHMLLTIYQICRLGKTRMENRFYPVLIDKPFSRLEVDGLIHTESALPVNI